ncbi:VanZ family protein [Jeotgalibacillus sp. S-D1]|uniref:VanZ family protein n=1 Tax=Jeotgalibacillus sp. S-D1 TaxID=2552189 RepID=UPI001059293A|nr:VanZ family protein [Jeotgalibacillus sp. S-D1]TDL32635.1 VanZ family protein [Jeotgalibacillus sp. S-D1]
MRKLYKKKIHNARVKGALFRLLPFLAFCGVIWYSSSLTYDQQSLIPFLNIFLSEKELLIGFLDGIEFSYGGSIVSISASGYAGFIEFFLRKFAHLSIFFMIGLFLGSFLFYFIQKLWLSSLFTLLFIVLFAALDEYRQYLTGGRTPLMEDVFLDTIGGTAAIITYCIYRINKKKKDR